MPRYKKTERDGAMSDTRRMLLEAAAEEFAREGFAGANVNRISRAAGFAKGTVYNYFDSKRALMLALIDETAEAHIGYLVEQVLREDDPQRRLERFYQAGFDWVSDNPARAWTIFTTLNGPDAEFKLHIYQAYQPMFQLVGSDIIAAGVERGVFRQVDPDATALLLMTIYLGTSSQLSEQGRPWMDAAQVADFALHALRK